MSLMVGHVTSSGHLRVIFGNLREVFGNLWEGFKTSSERVCDIFGKGSEGRREMFGSRDVIVGKGSGHVMSSLGRVRVT